ncbi:ATP-grasp enzyme [Halomonas sp. PR-M31]|uniref:ATP-grasp enzyme n=1 Tax=Halomonas sp. PR-M31 TaxID=1471202 RepID=UPI000650CB4A|nr:ATP-grasp enzyme [Halomonas sp. PR-M31]
MTEQYFGKTPLTLIALFLLLPFNALICLTALIACMIARARGSKLGRVEAENPKTVLVSGGKMTKALQLARSFHQAGHRVILIESPRYWLTGHRFSTAVDRFYTVPAPDSPNYAKALLDIVQRENVDTYVPVCSPVASLFDSKAITTLAPHCDVVHVSPDVIEKLDDKHQFAEISQSLDLLAPKSFRITHAEQVTQFDFSQYNRQFILKSIRYDSVRRLDLTKLPMPTPAETAAFVATLPISEENPWVMQEFIPGTEYCTHGTLRDGELRVHCCCLSSAFQINYASVDAPEIENWIRHYGKALALTGQASFDFIQADDDGKYYAIECNPRTHSAITMFYNHPGVAAAYLERNTLPEPIRPLSSSRPTYWLYHELWRLLTHLNSPSYALERLKVIARGKDAVFDWRDPLPFLMLHHWHVPLLLLRDLRERRGWLRIDFNIGKLVQLGGD